MVFGRAESYSSITGSWQAVIGIMPRMPVLRVGMRITISGIRIRISATSTARTWIPGGTQSNNGTGTIEMEIVPLASFNSTSMYYFSHAVSTDKQRIEIYDDATTGLYAQTSDSTTNSTISASGTGTVGTPFNIAFLWNSISSKLFKNGSQLSTSYSNPKLPNTYVAFKLGSRYNGTLIINSLIRNVTVSLPKRADSDVTNRNTQNVNGVGFKVDKEIKLVAPLKTNLNAYRVKA